MEEKKPRGRKRPLISAESFELADDGVEQVQFDIAENTSEPPTESAPVQEEENEADDVLEEDDITEDSDDYYDDGEASENDDEHTEATHVEIFDGETKTVEDYEGDDAYVYNTDAFLDNALSGIEGAVRKRGGVTRLARGSLILRFIKYLFVAIVHGIRSSAIFGLVTKNTRIKTAFRNSRLAGFFKSSRVSMAFLRFRRSVIRQMAQSSILSGRQELGTAILRTPARYYGVFLIAVGLSTVGFYLGNLYYIGYYFKLPVSQPLIGAVLTVLGCAILLFSGTLAELIRNSYILKLILFKFFGISIKLDDESPLEVSYSKIAVFGIGIGILSLFVPLYQVIIALALILGGVVILKSPETGVLLTIVSLCFFPLQFACALILSVWVSFILKFFSGKRVLSFEYVDIFPLIAMVIFLFGGLISLGEARPSMLLPAAMVSLYFLVSGLIRDTVWAGRCRVTFIICGLISSALIILRKLPGNPVELSLNIYSASDQGGIMDSALENSGILVMLLSMVFFMQLANFYSRKTKGERFGHFILCAVFATALLFQPNARAATLFILMTLFAVTALLKGLRSLVPITVAVLLVMPIFGFPTLGEIFSEISAELSTRVTLWQDTTQIMSAYQGKVGWLGIGMRTDAVEALYTGELSFAGTGSLILWLVLTLGIPTALLIFIIPAVMYNYCLAHGQRCSDKGTPSRLHTYGGLFAISYMLLMGLTENVWYNYRTAAFYWLILGFTVSVQRYSVGDTSQGYVSDHAIIPEI